MTEYVSVPLDIEGVKVNHVELTTDGEVYIYVNSTVKGTHCSHCGREINEVHDYGREVKIRHLSILGMPTYIVIKPCRYICRQCPGGPTTTQSLPWYESRNSITHSYAEHVLKLLVNSTVMDVAQKEGIGYDTVEAIIGREFGESLDWGTLTELPILGIDEISLKKGHRDFATIVTVRDDSGHTRILGVLENRDKANVKAFFSSIPKHLRDTVRVVCSDLYEGYTEAAREVFGPEVVIAADRFHVAKLYRGVVDEIRKKEMHRLKEERSEEDYGKLKGAMWLVRKNPHELNKDELATLRLLLNSSPVLKSAYLYAGTLTELFEKPVSKPEAEELIRAWIRTVEASSLPYFDRFLRTLNEKLDLITNYFIQRHTSGFVEGINHKIRVLLWRSYGLFNRVHLFQRLALDLGGYEQFA